VDPGFQPTFGGEAAWRIGESARRQVHLNFIPFVTFVRHVSGYEEAMFYLRMDTISTIER
jgi:hypothetical protein